ncbi:hypothetical protein V6N11_039778 [Hibiscus sabdariffa]|uniref:Uncharacterized protein n=1 Tax=Hibiscus sabdariffa TaxID=183260 RepID=A0ABR2RFU5_9ROSI
MPSSSNILEDPRLPKKMCRRDEVPHNMRNVFLAFPIPSNPKPLAQMEYLYPLKDDEINLMEDDVQIDEINGVPSITFLEIVQSLTLKSLDLTLVVKDLDRRLGYNTVHNIIFNIWKASHSLKLIDIDND